MLARGRPLALALLWLLLVCPQVSLSSHRTAFAAAPSSPSSEAAWDDPDDWTPGEKDRRLAARRHAEKRARARARARAVAAKEIWEAEADGALYSVLHSYDGHFEEVLLASQRRSENDHGVFVFFFAPECPYSKQARGGIVRVSAALAKAGVVHQIAAIDVESNQRLAEKYAVTQTPTARFFRKGQWVPDHQVFTGWFGAPPGDEHALFSFMMRLDNPEWQFDELERESLGSPPRSESIPSPPLSTPMLIQHSLCPALSDDEIRSRFGDRQVEIEKSKKEDRSGPIDKLWTIGKFLNRYHHPTKYYLVSPLPVEWQEECSDLGGVLGDLKTQWNWWMSSGGTSSVLHQDDYENFNCVLEGNKTFRVAPGKWRSAAYFTKGPGYGWYSDVDMDAPEDETAKHFPEFAAIPFQTYLVKAGECLYIPLRWLHAVRSEPDPETGRNMAINVWFKTRTPAETA